MPLTTRKAVTFRMRLVVTPLRLFLDDDSSSGGEEKEEKRNVIRRKTAVP